MPVEAALSPEVIEPAIPALREIVIFLIAASIIAPVFHRIRISPVLGFLVAGALIGPFGLGRIGAETEWLRYAVISDLEGVRTLGELGVVFLLFMIGLELSFARLWQLRRLVFGLGTAQVVLSAGVIAGVALWFGNDADAAITVGLCLALSSTAIVMQLLTERRELNTLLGRATFSVLLMQDLAVVPILFLLGVLGGENGAAVAVALPMAILRAVAILAVIYFAGKALLRPLFNLSGRTRSPEFFVAAVLLIVITVAAATSAFGLSMALGAFLAGMLIAETEYRHQVEVDIEPFKGLLLGVFFMSVGMGIDLRLVVGDLFWIAAAVAGLYTVKTAIIGGLAVLFRLPAPVAVEMGLLLGAGGEFAFVILGLAMQTGFVPPAVGQFMLVVASISMLLTPLAAKGAAALARLLEQRTGDARAEAGLAEFSGFGDHVLIAGFGRVGRTIAEVLEQEEVPYVALDGDADNATRARREGRPVYFGNAARLEILKRANLKAARAFVVTVDNMHAAEEIVRRARSEAPQVPIVARARDAAQVQRLLAAGATRAVPEVVEASLQLGGRVLESIGVPEDVVARRIAACRPEESPPGQIVGGSSADQAQ